MKKLTKVLLLVVALCMMIAVMGIAAAATGDSVAKIGETEYATLADAITAAQSDDEIVLLEDIEISGNLSLSKKFTLDLNGHVITSSGTFNSYSSNTDLTIKDGGEGGAINFSANKGFYISGGKLTLESGSISVSSSSGTTGIDVGSGGTFVMTGGSITIPSTASTSNSNGNNYAVKNYGSTTISGGAIIAESAGCNYAVSNSGTLLVSGGSIEASNANNSLKAPYAVYVTGGTASITGGTIIVDDHDTYGWSDAHLVYGSGTISVTGGKYKSTKALCFDELESKLPSGYILSAADADGYRTVMRLVAQIGTTKYTSLQAAINAAQSGDTIELLCDIEISSMVNLDKTGTYTIDGGNHTISMASGTTFGGSGAIVFGPAGTNPIADVNQIPNKTYTLQNVTISGFDAEILRIEGCGLTLDNVTFEDNDITKTLGRGYHLVRVANANVTIQNSTFADNKVTVESKDGDVIYVDETSLFTLSNCLFDDNAVDGHSIVRIAGGSGHSVTNNTFIGNEVSSSSNGAVLYLSKPATVTYNLFKQNSVTEFSNGKEAVIVLGSGAIESVVNFNAFDGNTLAVTHTTEAKSGTIHTGATCDLSYNYWGGNAESDIKGSSNLATNENYAVSYTPRANANGCTVTLYVPSVAQIGNDFYTSLAEAIAAVKTAASSERTTITLLADTNEVPVIDFTYPVQINGQGHKLGLGGASAGYAMRITAVGADVIIDNTVVGSMSVGRGINVNASGVNLVVQNNSEVYGSSYPINVYANQSGITVDNNHITITNSTIKGYCALNLWGANGVVDVTGSTLWGENNASYSPNNNEFGAIALEGLSNTPGATGYTVNVTNTTIKVTSTKGNEQYPVVFNPNSSNNTVYLTSCTIDRENATLYPLVHDEGISGNKTYVKGTTDSTTSATPVLPSGYNYCEAADGYKLVGTAVAKIGEATYYASLADAIAAVPTDGTATTIKMIADSVEAGTITIASTKNIVLDLNGHTVSYTENASGKSVYFITNKGTLTVRDTSEGAGGSITYASGNSNYSYESVTVYNLGGTLNLVSGSIVNNLGGLAYAVNNSSNAWGVNDDKETVFNMTGGVLSAPNGDAALRVYQNCSQAADPYSHNTVTISGGTLDMGIFVDTYIYNPNANTTGAGISTNITITGGTINGLIDLKLRHPYNTTLNIEGGDFTNAKLWVRKHSEWNAVTPEPTSPIVTISGGTWSFVTGMAFGLSYDCGATSWTSYEQPYYVTGGVFNVDLNNYSSIKFESGKTGVANSGANKATYPYTVGVAVAQIGTTKYASLYDAAAAVQNGNTITMIANTLETNEVIFNFNGSATLDLNGHTVATNEDIWIRTGRLTVVGGEGSKVTSLGNNSNGYGFYVSTTSLATNDAILTIDSDNVTVDAKEYGVVLMTNGVFNLVKGHIVSHNNPAVSGNGTAPNVTANISGGSIESSGVAIYFPATASLNITGGTITGTTAIYQKCGTLTISGGIITATGEAAEYSYYDNGGNPTGDAIVIDNCGYPSGAPSTNISGATIISEHGKQIGYYVHENNEEGTVRADIQYTLNTNTEKEWVADTSVTGYSYRIATPTYVAKIGDVRYETLQAAINAAQSGDTITLLANVTQDAGILFNKANASVKLDLNGKTLTVNNGSNINYRAIRIDNGTLEVYNGSIVAVGSGTTSSNGTGCYGAFRVEANGKLIAHDLTLTNSRPWGLNVKVLGGEAELTNVTINSSYGGGIEVTEADLGTHSKAGKATLTNCTFTQGNYYDHCSTALSVSGGSELIVNSGSYTGEYALYVFSSGGKIKVNGGTFTGLGNNNRCAIVAAIDTTTYPEYKGGLEISGGSFSGGYNITSPAYMTITGGYFTVNPTTYVADGYAAENGTYEIGGVTYNYKVSLKYNEATSTADTTQTVSKTTDEETGTTTTTTTTTNLAADTSGATPTYAIKIETTVTTTPQQGVGTSNTETVYQPVQTSVNTANKTEGAEETGSTVSTDNAEAAAAAAVAVKNAVENATAATFTAALAANDVNKTEAKVLQTTAAANAIAKAAATVNSNETANIAKAKIELQTTLKSYTLKDGETTAVKATKVVYDIKPVAVLYKVVNETETAIGQPVELNNDDIKEGESFTFTIPVPVSFETENVKVSHKGTSGETSDIGIYPVQKIMDGDVVVAKYVTVTVTHFSEFELEETELTSIAGGAKLSVSISLEDSIDINFYVRELATGTNVNNYSVKYYINGSSTPSGVISGSTWATKHATDVEGKYRFKVATFAAKEMTDTVTFEIYYNDVLIKSVENYSIRQYCLTKISANTDSKLVTLCKAVLDYGTAAQRYFHYKTNNLASGTTYYTEVGSKVIDSEYNKLKVNVSANGISKFTTNLTLQSKTELNFFLAGTEIEFDSVENVTTSTADVTYIYTVNENGISIKIRGITATDLATVYRIHFTIGGEARSIEYSPMTYAHKMSTSGKNSDTHDICKALCLYYEAAKAYFAN